MTLGQSLNLSELSFLSTNCYGPRHLSDPPRHGQVLGGLVSGMALGSWGTMGWRGSNSHPTVPRTVSFSLSEVLSGAFTPGRGLPPPLPISSLWLEIRRSSLGSVFLCPLLRLHLHRRAESVSSPPSLPPSALLASAPAPSLLHAARHRARPCHRPRSRPPRAVPPCTELTKAPEVRAHSCLGPCPSPASSVPPEH